MAGSNDGPILDADLRSVRDILDLHYKTAHPGARIDSDRENSVSLRIRIIDSDFRGKSRARRHDEIWKILERLPEDVQSQIDLVLPLTPGELKTSLANLDFENSKPSTP